MGSAAPGQAPSAKEGEREFEFIGGRVCLDFCNTGRPEVRERLPSYAALLRWATAAGLLGATQAARLRRAATAHPTDAERTLALAHALRQAFADVLSCVGDGRRAAPADLATINGALPRALGQLVLRPSEDGYRLEWPDSDALDAVLWPVARSMSELLSSPELARIHRCDADRCDWVFLDETRNRTRRWCEMKVCGNRAKARRHYQRTRRER